MAAIIAGAIKSAIEPLGKQIADLRGELGALEAKNNLQRAQLAELQKAYLAMVQRQESAAGRAEKRHEGRPS